MRAVIRHMRSAAAAFAIATFCAPAFSADPLTLLLLRLLRDKIISAGIESAVERAATPQSVPPPVRSLPGLPYAGFDEAQLRRLQSDDRVAVVLEPFGGGTSYEPDGFGSSTSDARTHTAGRL